MFTKVNSYVRSRACGTWSRISGSWIIGGMGESSEFVPNGTKFNFAQELKKARRALEDRVAAYASENPHLSYRDLRDTFGLSLGALSKIMKRRQNPKASRVSFLVRYERGGEKVVTVVTVRGRASTEQKRLRLTELYKTRDVALGDDPSISWRTEYTAWDLGLRGRRKIRKRAQR